MRTATTRKPGSDAGRRPSRVRDPGSTREALLTAAADLFAERGYDGVRVWAIAERAGVNKAMISYHFGGKRKLYLTILGATFAEILSRVEALAEAPRPAPEVLRDLIAAMADVGERRHVFGMMLREALAGGKQLERGVLDKPLRVLAAVRRILERGVADGAFRPVDPLLTHLSLVGSLAFFFATAHFRERLLADSDLGIESPDGAAYVRHLQDLITHGLAADSAPIPTRHRERRRTGR
jgi:TetR/AcrR family transcriptional regulator